jgi:alpha-tubulin suppressor-like RCC1 family protein
MVAILGIKMPTFAYTQTHGLTGALHKLVGSWCAIIRLSFAMLVAGLALSGCGGSPSASPSPTPPTVTVLQVTTQPASTTVIDGASAQFSVVVSGAPLLTYQWRKNGVDVVGATASTLTQTAVYADNNTRYSVLVKSSDGASVTSVEATLTVSPVALTISRQPVALISALVGQTVTFDVQVQGTGPYTYQWNKNGAAISGATAAAFTIAAIAQTDNNAQYNVQVTNPAGSAASDSANIIVAATPQPPVITSNPTALITVAVGQTASMSVTATSADPMTYQWTHNSVAITGATNANYTTPALGEADTGSIYDVTVSNSAGSVTSTSTTVQVIVPISIAIQPQSITTIEGQTATFGVTASGTGPIYYQWQKAGKDIIGSMGSTYTTAATALTDSGTTYAVVVGDGRNIGNRITSDSVILTVIPAPAAPTISKQPVDVVARVGTTATFSVSAAGAAPLSYQWSKNGAPIAGATAASYTTPNLTTSDDGALFAVVVSNLVTPSAQSTTAKVSVVPAVLQLATGNFHSLALAADGTVWAWGSNLTGQLGVSLIGLTPGVPARVINADGSTFTGVTALAAGSGHSLALRSDGTVWGWGDGAYGALADGQVSAHTVRAPIQVKDGAGVALSGVTAIAAGVNFSMALKADGTVWTWGNDAYGKLGNGAAFQSHSARPVQVLVSLGNALSGVTKIATNGNHVLAIKAGRVWSWGDNQDGDLGNGLLAASGLAVPVELSAGVPLDNIVDIAAGFTHSLALTLDGKVYSWGTNTDGALGDGTTSRRTRPVAVTDATGSAIGGVAGLAAGQNTTLLVMANGNVLMSGNNTYGQQGGAVANSNHPSPANITGVDKAVLSFNHILARRTDGNVYAWGFDNAFQLGNPVRSSLWQAAPAKVNGL